MKLKKIGKKEGKDLAEGNGSENLQFSQMTKNGDKSSLLKRARAKYFTNGIIFHLLDLDSSLKKNYWNTYYCSNLLVEADGKIVTKYCKNRWCMVCNRIRTAVEINKYKPIIESWESKYFVTLTVVNPKAEELSSTIDKMFKEFYSCVRAIKYNKLDFVAVRKLEITFNPYRDDYHPHFHLLVNGKEQSDMLVDLWLKRFPTSKKDAQNITTVKNDVDSKDKSYIEMFKYFTKLLSSKSSKAKSESDLFNAPVEYRRRIYITALDTIYRNIAGKRIYAHYGFNLPSDDEDSVFNEDSIDNKLDNYIYWHWESEVSDWVNRVSGEYLTNYKPTKKLKELLEKGVVK